MTLLHVRMTCGGAGVEGDDMLVEAVLPPWIGWIVVEGLNRDRTSETKIIHIRF
jgi:hypothetical protein